MKEVTVADHKICYLIPSAEREWQREFRYGELIIAYSVTLATLYPVSMLGTFTMYNSRSRPQRIAKNAEHDGPPSYPNRRWMASLKACHSGYGV